MDCTWDWRFIIEIQVGDSRQEINKRYRILTSRLNCGIYGKIIKGEVSRDHVFPRSLYKWSEYSVTEAEYKRIIRTIEQPGNIIEVHSCCNYLKEDALPNIDSLYISDKRKENLRHIEYSLSKTIDRYIENKHNLWVSQGGRCYSCGGPIDEMDVLRRIDPEEGRRWTNACLVCHKCNIENMNFIDVKRVIE